MLSLRQFSRCGPGVISQMWPMWIRNSSSFEVGKNTFPAKGNTKSGDEEQEVVKKTFPAKGNACGDEELEVVEPRLKHYRFGGDLGEREETRMREMEAYWRQKEQEYRMQEREWLEIEDEWLEIEDELREEWAEAEGDAE